MALRETLILEEEKQKRMLVSSEKDAVDRDQRKIQERNEHISEVNASKSHDCENPRKSEIHSDL
jgi:hypothetical protein